MALQDDINLFVNKANSKISEYTDDINTSLSQGLQNDSKLDLCSELLDFVESLLHTNNPWSEDDFYYWMNFMDSRHELTDIVYQDSDPYITPVLIINANNGDGITWAQLASALLPYTTKDNELQAEIDALELVVQNLLPPTLVADVAQIIIDLGNLTDEVAGIAQYLGQLDDSFTAHVNNNNLHIQAGEREAWNAKVSTSELNSALSGKAESNHTHSTSQVDGLDSILSDLQDQIDNIAPADGITPTITIGTVQEDVTPSVEVDPSSTPENVVFNFKLKTGEAFRIDQMGMLAGRSAYDTESAGFTYMDTATGFVYFRVGNELGTWSNAIPFRGDNGWSPVWAYDEISPARVIKRLVEWVGGTGTAPDLDELYSMPDGTIWYAGPSGFTSDEAEAVNVRGAEGRRFRIDIEGSDRSLYDSELEGFTFLNEITGKVSFKLSDTPADWSSDFPWVGITSVLTAYLTLSSAQLKACGTTPVILIAAPGVNKFFSIISVSVSYKYVSEAFAHTDALVIKSNGGDIQFLIGSYLNDASSVNIDLVKQGQVQPSNVDYVLTTLDGSDSITGDGTLTIEITYKKINSNV